METEHTQLLCTFISSDKLDDTLNIIQNNYRLVFNKVYVLGNTDDADQLILTYNVARIGNNNITPLISTISVHRKKQTNTIYTINAINRLIEQKNKGVLDKSFRIDWESLRNTVLVTAYSRLKIVNTVLHTIIETPLDR
jgi:hypothetical protein